MKYYSALHQLRGVMSLVVVLGHCLSVYKAPSVLSIFFDGVNTHYAVIVFFILSGVVVGQSVLGKVSSGHELKRFVLARFFRIFPVLFVCSLMSLGLIIYFNNSRIDIASEWWNGRFLDERFGAVHILLSFLALSSFLLPPVWSIFVELIGYFFIVLIFLFRRTCVPWVVLFFLSLNLAFEIFPGPHRVFYYLINFLSGIFLIDLSRFYFRVRYFYFYLFLMVLFSFMSVVSIIRDEVAYQISFFAESFAGFLIVLAGMYVKPVVGWLNSFANWLGDISYSLYLVHFPVLYFLVHVFDNLFVFNEFWIGGILFVCNLIISFILSHFLFKLVEVPFVRFSKNRSFSFGRCGD